jgi:hypothetical protein
MIFKDLTIESKKQAAEDLGGKRTWRRQEDIERANRKVLNHYYEGEQIGFLKEYGFMDDGVWVIAPSFLNITKKIIDKISMVYKYPPSRKLVNEKGEDLEKAELYEQWISYVGIFDNYIQEAEERKNLHHKVLHRSHYDTYTQQWKFWIYDDYLAHFLDTDPLNPVGYSIPVNPRVDKEDEVSQNGQIYLYFDDKHYFWYNTNGKFWTYFYDSDGNKVDNEGENPYEKSPFNELRKGVPVNSYYVPGAVELIRMNEAINVNLNNLNMALHYQAFGIVWDNTGLKGDNAPTIKIGANKMTHMPKETTLNNLELNPQLIDMIETIKYEIQAVANMYHLNVNWHNEASPVSGFSLIVQNQDYIEERQKSVDEAEKQEKEIFKTIKAIQGYHSADMKEDEPKIPEDSYLFVDFAEIDLPVNQSEDREQEKYEIENNIVSILDVIKSRNPDMDDNQAKKKLAENKKINGRLTSVEQAREELEETGVTFEE